MLIKPRLEEIRDRLIQMAEMADLMIENAVKAIIEHNPEYLKVVEELEPKVDQMEVENETLIITTIARFQPEAKYLRILVMDLFVNRDIERIGDHAENIKEQAERILTKPKLKEYVDLPVMTEIVLGMVKDAVKSLENLDTELARDVITRDDRVDALHEQIIREIYTYMVEDPKNIKVGIRLITVSSNLERVADIATNLAEEVIYMKEGKMLRHQELDKDE
ncbi:MAG TPA: phosphate transport system regulatory protein PhoU [Persephonella sp.]|uniref:Phosphate-specific transport system accessory protein PhoU n=1 Tax=Persephonella marina (strain DSM 14350 / EX-H1) TaxID=123214 RepID=C0QRP7_PERMH|nr:MULTISPECIES: phosphate signaling complex protein PhoU [Persephonella]ACO04217.1 phosphate transport system regulatory protein PhoU [Persephonella marina EX-H1]HCB69088.1 phosphate transport system regulatory protein PhoU [Persephonella sp.]